MSPRKQRQAPPEARPSSQEQSFLEEAAFLIFHLLGLMSDREAEKHGFNDRKRALRIAWELGTLRGRWERGEFKTLDEAFGWKRPKGWRQASARSRAKYRWPVLYAVHTALAHGAKTPEVFDQVRRHKKIPLSAARIEKLYYDGLKETRPDLKPSDDFVKRVRRARTRRTI